METQIKELPYFKESTADFDRMEKRIKAFFRKWLYTPLLKELELPVKTISNANESSENLVRALQIGRVTVSRGVFKGKFDAGVSKELRSLGAVWDKKTSTFKLPTSEQPMEIRDAVSTGNARFQERMARVDKRLSQKLPEEITVKTKDLFQSTISKTDREIAKTLRDVSVYPKLSTDEQAKIAGEWQNNMDLWINNFSKEEIVRLRKDVAASVSQGNRYESLTESIQRSYGVTANKAKFLARQETSLLMAKFKETRYASSGVSEYKWKCVAGSKNHPVRPSHKILDGKIFAWNNPPITTAPDQPTRRNNPGQDYNCRCAAIPIVRFRK